MFIRAYYNHSRGRLEFLASHLDGPRCDARTGELISLGDAYETLLGDSELEFLDWQTGRSKYDALGRRIA